MIIYISVFLPDGIAVQNKVATSILRPCTPEQPKPLEYYSDELKNMVAEEQKIDAKYLTTKIYIRHAGKYYKLSNKE